MTEVFVFLIVGAIAILSAAFMLISENAVHSALFLVLNFFCVAFFFLTLSAPFIALIQITVYAGAIMVLFLFVIMLLGAERVVPGAGPYHWLPRAAIALALVFLLTIGLAVAGGNVNFNNPPPPQPMLRLIHAADGPPFDVYLNNQLFEENVVYRQATGYRSVPAGEYAIAIYPAGADPATSAPAILGDFTLTNNSAISVAMLGAGSTYTLSRLVDNPFSTGADQARLTVLNGLPDAGPIDLVDPGLPSTTDDDDVLIASASFAEPIGTLLVEAAEARTLTIRPSGSPGASPLVTYHDLALARDTNNILIPSPERLSTGGMRVVPLVIATAALPEFGSPQAVGAELYTAYLLPFELVSVLLLTAMVGAVVLTRRDLIAEHRPRRQVVRRPLVGPQAASALATQIGDQESVEQILSEPAPPAEPTPEGT